MIPAIVLVRPQFSGNLGSVARAMKNMGLGELRLVKPEALPGDRDAVQMAVHAEDILRRAQIFSDLKSALEGFDLIIGTSRRVGGDRGNWFSPREFAEFLGTLSKNQRVATVFGTEDSGLTNEEIQLCHRLIQIPSHFDSPSLNLAQAVMIVCYELFLAQGGADNREESSDPDDSIAKFENLEGMYRDLNQLLRESGFLDRNNPDHMMRMLRNLYNRAHLTEREVKIIRGICRQLRWWGES